MNKSFIKTIEYSSQNKEILVLLDDDELNDFQSDLEQIIDSFDHHDYLGEHSLSSNSINSTLLVPS